MKLGSRKLNPYVRTAVIPRGDGPVVFTLCAVLDHTDFEKLCPLPKPPVIQRPGEPSALNVNDPEFQKKLQEYSARKSDWVFLESIKQTPELVWEKVKMDDPSTWKLWRDELRESHFSQAEINIIFVEFLRAQSLDDTHLKEARETFFLAQAAELLKSAYLPDDQSHTSFGEPASASESDLQK